MSSSRRGGGGASVVGSKSEIASIDRRRINDALDKKLEKSLPSTSKGSSAYYSNKEKNTTTTTNTSRLLSVPTSVSATGVKQVVDTRDRDKLKSSDDDDDG